MSQRFSRVLRVKVWLKKGFHLHLAANTLTHWHVNGAIAIMLGVNLQGKAEVLIHT